MMKIDLHIQLKNADGTPMEVAKEEDSKDIKLFRLGDLFANALVADVDLDKEGAPIQENGQPKMCSMHEKFRRGALAEKIRIIKEDKNKEGKVVRIVQIDIIEAKKIADLVGNFSPSHIVYQVWNLLDVKPIG